MNVLAKVGLGCGVATSLGGMGYGIYSNIVNKTYSTLLKDTLLNTKDEKHRNNWTARLASLNTANENTLIESLKTVKKKSGVAWNDLRDWCNGVINNVSAGEKSTEFQNIQTYCTFSIKEKLTNAIADNTEEGNEAWKKGHDALQTIDNKELDETLIAHKSKTELEAKRAIKTWCTSAYQKPYKGDNDKEFNIAKKICVTTS